MTTLTFPLSRIEGHARVIIEVQDGEVVSASFQAMEMRGFGYFVQGTPAEQMPVIVPRICGVCSTAHHVAAVKTLEDIDGVKPPALARQIRELLLLGQLIQNQATSLFIFTMPDRLNAASIFELSEQEQQAADQAGIAPRALQVRKAGTDLITLAGGQFIHPVKAVVGGMSSGIPASAAGSLRAELERTLPIAHDLFQVYWDASLALRDRIGTWGDDEPAFYIASTNDIEPRYDTEGMRLMGPDGGVHESFHPHDFRAYLSYENNEYSYAGQTSFRGNILRANSLARINMTSFLGTPLADELLARFRKEFGQPAHAILLFDLCRGIELVYAIERAIHILSQPLDGEASLYRRSAVPHKPRDGEGYGMVEAPRGPLIHHYTVEHGLITQAEFIIPTVHNILAIERALMVAARRYITPDHISLELEKAVGRVVRAFDPCIACATH
jgi:coenzyme F420-reducing hydrogenase alpha subunit